MTGKGSATEKECIPKPILKGLHHKRAMFHLGAAIFLSAFCVMSFKVFHNDARKRKYIEFYRNYDAEKSFNRMRDAGLLQSCKPSSCP